MRAAKHCVRCGRMVYLAGYEALCVTCQWGETNASYGRRVMLRARVYTATRLRLGPP